MLIRLTSICAALLAVQFHTAEATAQQPREANSPKRVTGRGFPRLSPFRAMRRAGDELDVQIDGDDWFRLVSVRGIETGDLIRRSKEVCGRKWYERIREDLVEVLTVLSGDEIGNTVDLEVRKLTRGKPGKKKKLKAVEMTRDKRQRMMRGDDDDDDAKKRRGGKLEPAFVAHDLRELTSILSERFSYFALREIDLDGLRKQAQERTEARGCDTDEFKHQVALLLRAFGDGHTRVRGAGGPRAPGFSPFLIDRVDDGYVAFASDRADLLDRKRPYVVAIDGVPIEKWIEASARSATQGSPQMIARDAVRGLRRVNELRADLGLAIESQLEVTLRGDAGERTLRLRVTNRDYPVYGRWPRTEDHARLDGDIGYLRIASMDSEDRFLDGLDRAMEEFRDTKGLVIDVRSNGGGTRHALRRLFPYFMGKNEKPVVVNIAAFRIPPDQRDAPMPDEGYLANRYLYPLSWDGWTKSQRRAAKDAQRRFRPEWKPGDGFSEWHYFVIDRSANPGAYHYDRPVVLLIDDGCFSATDIFVGAFKGRPGFTLLGTATMGGSGRSRPHRLPNSGIELRVSSMASFRANGKLYERRGIRPDLVMPKIPTDFVRGGTDSQLEAALARLRD